jgi:hypothetical protein
VCEKYNHHIRRRFDAFGFGDVLVMDDHPGALLIQACSAGDMSKRARKIIDDCTDNARAWLTRGNRIQVWGWRKGGPVGKRKTWRHREVAITLADLVAS